MKFFRGHSKKLKKIARRIRGRRISRWRVFFVFFGVLLSFILFVASTSALYVSFLVVKLPSSSQLQTKKIVESTKLFDRTGKILLYEAHGEERRTIIPFEEIPGYLKKAALAAEDDNFYNQPAFDWKAIARSALVNLKERRFAQGGSTITQQLAKNVFLSREKTLTRKLKELIIAIELESRYSKDEILNLYLNQIPFGSNAYGVEAASETYFDKHAKELTLSESALLASLLKAPTYFSPFGSNAKELFQRQHYVLDRMVALGFASKEEAEKAKKEKLAIIQRPALMRAYHFSLAVRDYLLEKYGEKAVMNDGLRVITTLDWKLQEIAERAITEGAARNSELYDGRNAALVAQDPKTGQILALVGSKDPFLDSEPAGCVPGVSCKFEPSFNVALQGLRQPGSALKPFAYATAFSKGYLPQSVVFDVPTEFSAQNPNCPASHNFLVENKECFHPRNFDGIFRGPTTLAEGLSQSLNIPSVKVLYLAGFDSVLGTLRDFGISTLGERARYGLSLVLGGGEVRLVELVNAYATLSQEGTRNEQKMLLEVKSREGKVLESYKDKAKRVMDSQYPRMVSQILSDKDLRSELFQGSLSLTVFPGREVALKTGTTNDYRDAWAMGYTPSLTVGVWAGNNDNTALQKSGGSILAAVPIWSSFLREALTNFPSETFTRPLPQELPSKPMLNGVWASPAVPGSSPQAHSILYYVDKNDPLGAFPNNPYQDSQFVNWEEAVQAWARGNISSYSSYQKALPSSFFGGLAPVFSETIDVMNVLPKNGSFVSSPFLVSADVVSEKDIKTVQLYVNDKLVSNVSPQGTSYPFRWYVFDQLQEENKIFLKVFDKDGGVRQSDWIVYK